MLVVFTVLALAMLPLASIQMRSRHQINEASRETQALQLAQAQIERVKMMGFNAAVGDSATVGPFSYNTRVVPDPVNPFLSEIRTTVVWSYGGDDRSITLASKLAAR
jgi:Tfp pilus assembly protein PilV